MATKASEVLPVESSTPQDLGKIQYEPSMLYAQTAFLWFRQMYFQQPDIDAVLRQAGISRWQLRVLEADPQISQCVSTRRDALIGTPHHFEPAPGRSAVEDLFYEEMDANLPKILGNFFNAVLYGYCVLQTNWYQRRDGQIGLKQAWQCPMEWFYPDYLGGLWTRQMLWSTDEAGNSVVIADVHEPILAKFPGLYHLLVRDGSYNQPYGESLLSRLYYVCQWRRENMMLRLGWLDTWSDPIVIAKVNNYPAFLEAMKEQKVRKTIVYQGDPDDKVQSISPGVSGEFRALEEDLNQLIQQMILGQNLTSSVKGGSLAAAQVHNQVREDKRNSDIQLITPAVQRIVDVLAALNNLPAPTFVMADDTGLEQERATRDATLIPALTASGLAFDKDYFVRAYDYTDADFTEALPAIPPPVGKESLPPGTSTSLAAGGFQFAAHPVDKSVDKSQKALDNLIDEALKAAPEQPLSAKAIRSAIMSAASREDLYHKLAGVLGESNPKFADVLTHALFTSQIWGFVSAHE